MNWGMMQGLGNAIAKAGETFGPQRLDLRSKLEEDKRRQQLAESQIATAKDTMATNAVQREQARAGIAGEGVRTAAAQYALDESKATETQRREALLNDYNTKKLNYDQAKAVFDSETDEQRKQAVALRLKGLQGELNRSEAQIRASDASAIASRAQAAASGRSGALADYQLQSIRETSQPTDVADRLMKEEFDEFQKRADIHFRSALAAIPMSTPTGLQLPGVDSASMAKIDADHKKEVLAQSSKALQGWARALATEWADKYEQVATARNQPPWGDPKDREGAIGNKMQQLIGTALMQMDANTGGPTVGAPTAAAPTGGNRVGNSAFGKAPPGAQR